MNKVSYRSVCTFIVLLLLLVLPATGQVPDPLPDPDGRAADSSRPVKVFILLGQSNMLGFGKVGPAETMGTLEHMISQKGK